MDIRKPKPVHSWRELAGEIGIIVLGITIALTGEQVVDWLHWRSEVAEVKETLNAEVREHLAQAAERVAIAPCESRQLRALDEVVRRPGPLPSRLPSPTMALRSWSTNGWTLASTSGVLPHMSAQDRSDYSENAEITKLIGEYNNQEFLALGDVGTLRPSTTPSETERDRVLSDIAKAQQLNVVLQAAAKEFIDKPIRSHPQHLTASEMALVERERQACMARASAASPPPAQPTG